MMRGRDIWMVTLAVAAVVAVALLINAAWGPKRHVQSPYGCEPKDIAANKYGNCK